MPVSIHLLKPWCLTAVLELSIRLRLVVGRRGGSSKGKRKTTPGDEDARECPLGHQLSSCLGFWLLWSRNRNSDQQIHRVMFDPRSAVAPRISNQWHWLRPLKVLAAFATVREKSSALLMMLDCAKCKMIHGGEF